MSVCCIIQVASSSMDASYPTPQEWLRGWREWARTRKRGRMAQFIVEKLEEGVSVY